MEKMKFDLIVVGAGASGLVCAITAARNAKKVLLLDKNPKLGKKILYTGNGRCNITNEHVLEDASNPLHYHGKYPKFVIPALNKFGLAATQKFFSELGLEFIKEADGRYFPSSNQAQSVVDVLEFELRRLGVDIKLEKAVTDVSFSKSAGLFKVVAGDDIYESQKLVLATGGKSYPKFGSTGDGYAFAKKFDHTVTDTFPAYVGLKVNSQICKELQGLKAGVIVKVFAGNKQVAQNSGILMFAHFGLSAPVILELSRQISERMSEDGGTVALKINFLPTIPRDQLDAFLMDRFKKLGHKLLGQSFVGLLPQKLFPAILASGDISAEAKCSQVSKQTRDKIAQLLGSFEFEVDDVLGFDEAHFTAGGVNVKEVNPNTMESRLQPGLFFTGEVLDIDGDCGGYNLQWAWSSGYVAGMNV